MNIQEYITSGIIESYVMGLCTKEEEQELESLRAKHPELNSAILLYEAELEKKMLQNETLPPVSVDNQILETIDNLGIKSSRKSDQIKAVDFRRMKFAVAASVLLLIGSIIFNLVLFNQTSQLKKQITKSGNDITLPFDDYKIMNDPGITPVAMYGVGSHAICRCTMFWDKKTGKAYIMIHHLIRSSDSKDYQLWAIVDGQPVSVGVIDDSIRGRFIAVENVPANATSFSVTLEKAGGNNTPTTEEEYLRGSI